MQAENLSDIQAVLQVLSSSAWHFAITVVIVAALIALLLEAVTDLGLRAVPHRTALRKALGVDAKGLEAVGIDNAMLRLGSDELAAQLAVIAGAPEGLLPPPPSDAPPTLRRLLLKVEPGPLPSPAMSLEKQLQAESLYVERQLDRLQVHLRARGQSMERGLAVGIGFVVVALALSNLWLSSAAAMALSVLVPLASALLAPMLRDILRSAIRRI